MKRFKKFAAVVLACVMALTLLTACGGGGGSASSAPFKYTAQQLTDSINGKLNASLLYDKDLGDRFATAVNAAVAAGQKFDNEYDAEAAVLWILESAGFGDDTKVATTVAQKGADVNLVASGLVSSMKQEGYQITNGKIGYAAGQLNVDGNYYIIFAIIE